jgi:organic hydroperoxide reductase OsmC/OhrA
MEANREFTTTLDQISDYEFMVKFDEQGIHTLLVDEAPPLGRGEGPNPIQMLAASLGNCLAASLLFCLRRARIEPRDIKATVKTKLTRNEKGRIRIGSIEVSVHPEFDEYVLGDVGRCLDLFEDFCIVTQSVRQGIDVQVKVTSSVPERTH